MPKMFPSLCGSYSNKVEFTPQTEKNKEQICR